MGIILFNSLIYTVLIVMSIAYKSKLFKIQKGY